MEQKHIVVRPRPNQPEHVKCANGTAAARHAEAFRGLCALVFLKLDGHLEL